MIRSRLPLATCALLLLATGARAEVTDVAQLFPASTLAYVELHGPADIGPELAAMVKGSVLEDSLKFVHARRDRTKDNRDLIVRDEFALLGLLASPEMLSEFRKIRGAAFGFTHFNERHEPEFALALLPGDSQAVGMAARAYLTVNPQARKIGDVLGVPVFQMRPGFINYNANGMPLPANEKPIEEGYNQATFAYTPGLFVIATSKAAVAEVLTRFKGEAKNSLAGNAAFKDMALKNRKAGLFWFVSPKELCEKLDAANKVTGDHIDADGYAWLKFVANLKTIRTVSGCLRFRDKGISIGADVMLEPDAKSPLLTILGGQAADANALKNTPPGTMLGLSLALPNENREKVVLEFLDTLAKANGTIGRMPSVAAKEISEKFKVALAADLIARTRTATLVVPSLQELPQGALSLPLLVLAAEDAATAEKWADGVRAIVGDLSGGMAMPEPSTEVIDGVKVFSLPAAGLPWKAPVHYAFDGKVFVVGLDRKLVASSLHERPGIGAGIDTNGAAAIGTFALGGLLRSLILAPKNSQDGESPKVVEGVPPGFGGGRFRRNANGQPIDPEVIKLEAKSFEEWLDTLAAMPPALGTIRRTSTSLQVAWFFPETQSGAMTKVIDKGIAWLERKFAASGRDANDQQGILFKQ